MVRPSSRTPWLRERSYTLRTCFTAAFIRSGRHCTDGHRFILIERLDLSGEVASDHVPPRLQGGRQFAGLQAEVAIEEPELADAFDASELRIHLIDALLNFRN